MSLATDSSSSDTIKIPLERSTDSELALLIKSMTALFRPSSSGAPLTLSSSELLSTISVKDLKTSKRIGSGGFADVFLLKHPTLGKLAIKRLRFTGGQEDTENERRRALREGKLLQSVTYDHILSCLGVLEALNSLFLVSPYIESGSISGFIRNHPEVDRVDWIVQISEAVNFLHKNGIVHGDIKAANVLVSDHLKALLCDFGLSKLCSAVTSIGQEGQGSTRWQSVELLERGSGKSFQSDIWAFGMFIYEVLNGRVPFYTYKADAAVVMAVSHRHERPPEEPSTSNGCRSYRRLWPVARQCWARNPAQRGSMQHAEDALALTRTQHLGSGFVLFFTDARTLVTKVDANAICLDLESGETREVHVGQLGVVFKAAWCGRWLVVGGSLDVGLIDVGEGRF